MIRKFLGRYDTGWGIKSRGYKGKAAGRSVRLAVAQKMNIGNLAKQGFIFL